MARPTLSERERAARQGVRAAQREHQRMGTDLTTRVEIFDVIDDEGIWLRFTPLANLYGMYLRDGDAVGILVNAQNPFTLQRYTAAHEYGHHVLGHLASADNAERIQRRAQDLREVAAQAFAGEFLMPLQLVNFTLRTMGLVGRQVTLTGRQVYQLSLELGVSYGAVVTQLVLQHKLAPDLGARLRKESPLDVKTGLAGVRPADSRADVWLLDESQEGRRFSPRLRDEVHVMLAETPSSGYVWQLVDPARAVLTLVDDQFQTSGGDVVGASGTRHVAFRVANEGASRLRLEKRRPWQQNGETRATFEATLGVIPLFTGDADDGVGEDRKQELLAEVPVA
jgi:Zn-dependent peptidase ImmA (M78 family)/predicted secreted protein